MSLSQTQIIRSLGEHLGHFERELEWGVSPGELRHLTSRIGELYVAMITRGQMALETNQRGYDVVSAAGERISVKTVTTSTHVQFNKNTFDQVDRVIILRLIVDENEVSIEEILDGPANEIVSATTRTKFDYQIKRSERTRPVLAHLSTDLTGSHGEYHIMQYENGTITVSKNGEQMPQAKPVLRQIAEALGLSHLNGNGNPMNTRTLGAAVLSKLNQNDAISIA